MKSTIITTEANEVLKPIHDRMPVIFAPGAEALWLDPTIQDLARLLPLLMRYLADKMEAYPVSRLVNSPWHDTPDCIVPIREGQATA